MSRCVRSLDKKSECKKQSARESHGETNVSLVTACTCASTARIAVAATGWALAGWLELSS
jgi:hypothetical protein